MNIFSFITILTSTCLLISFQNNPTQKLSTIKTLNITNNNTNDTNNLISKNLKNEHAIADENYTSSSYDEIGWELMKKESFGEIRIDLDSVEIFKLIGKPDSITTEDYWGADGTYHCNWFYTKIGITLGMYRVENIHNKKTHKKQVDRISIYAPCKLISKRGIGINSNINEVKKAYSKAIENKNTNNEYLIAGTVYGGLIFNMENSLVTEIFVGAMAE